ncbi:cytidine deaminase [Nesterenkonia haasae]|uniref:cytidine deaminase n=1 Tax=Nesterenkonia haasae TaxID=2587813 RepID=UPI001391FDD1|nr:cytidine deaminase [Nesterenkonia haasae]NDK31064.1 cytidine deaminase [Nesterenkonia haasae]
MADDVDFSVLTAAANQARGRAYAPYSQYQVGAAALTTDGRLITGCNVENASYGVGQCAENTLVGQLHLTGGGQITKFTCVNSQGETIMPCGRCRQLLNEFAADTFQILTPEGITDMEGILPQAFGPADLGKVAP